MHRTLSILTLLVGVGLGSLSAQSIGAALSGLVEDSQKLVVQRALVKAISRDTGDSVATLTDHEGQFRFPVLAAGAYDVEISATGFAVFKAESIRITVGESRSIRAALQPAAVAEVVNVTAEAVSAVKQDASESSSSYGVNLMNDLPMVAGGVGRNFRTQVYLTPGVSPSTQAHRPFAVNGARSRNNNYMVDSNDFNEIEGGLLMGRGASEQLLSTEAIAGMQVLTHNYKAEYGRQNGSIISIITKRGANDWHGLLFEYLRNDLFDSRNTFDVQKPPLRFNQFGFNVGGPIRKDRTFFFVNNEWFIRRQTAATTVQTLTATQKAAAVAAVAPLAALYPSPNLPGASLYRANPAVTGDQWSTVMRVDHELTRVQHIFWRSTVLRSTNRGVAGASFARYETPISPRGHSLQHIWTPRSGMVNEARFNYTRFTIYDQFVDPVALGDPAVNGLVGTVSVNGLSSLGQYSFMARSTAQNDCQWTDDLSYVSGRHSWKAGVAIRRLQLNNGTFAPSYTGILRFNSIADFLAGKAASYSRNVGNPYVGLRATEYNAYMQDDWRLSPRLTLNLGVRYEHNTVPAEVNGLIQDKYRFQPDHNNFAPRFGFAWLLDRSGRTVVRGAYGIYYNVIELSFVGLTRFNPPLIRSYSTASPVFPNLLSTATAGIPSGLVLPGPGARQPYAQHATFTIERELFNPRTTVSVGYVGTLGRKAPLTLRPNGGDAMPQATRPDPTAGVVNVLQTSANSSYHSLQATFNAMWRDLTLRSSYTWSKFIDVVTDYPSSNQGIDRGLLALDESNWNLNRAVSDLDLAHRLSVAYIYEIPFWRHKRLAGGWQLQGITSFQTGRPFTLYSGADNIAGSNSNRILNIPGTLVRNSASNRTAIQLVPGIARSAITPPRGTLGSIGRNTERGDSLIAWNASLFKSFRLSERFNLQFRAEAFNFTNGVNYVQPDGLLPSPTFGQAVSAYEARQIQFSVRLAF